VQCLYDAYGDKFIMLGLDVGLYVGLDTRQDALDFLEEFYITNSKAKAPHIPAPRGLWSLEYAHHHVRCF
jgi:hypothetical protein